MSSTHEQVYVDVQEHYVDAARTAGSGEMACCGSSVSAFGADNDDDIRVLRPSHRRNRSRLSSLTCDTAPDADRAQSVTNIVCAGNLDTAVEHFRRRLGRRLVVIDRRLLRRSSSIRAA